jgi:hypothetical protein
MVEDHGDVRATIAPLRIDSMNRQRWRQRPLSLDEVREAGLPALFAAYGDLLVYKDGVVYALPDLTVPLSLARPEEHPGAYVVRERVGIEYPWLHLADCACRFCEPGADRQVA